MNVKSIGSSISIHLDPLVCLRAGPFGPFLDPLITVATFPRKGVRRADHRAADNRGDALREDLQSVCSHCVRQRLERQGIVLHNLEIRSTLGSVCDYMSGSSHQ